ncbi:MAG: peptidylprolyl isomerase [Phycisphaerales bacterium JB063]
MPRTALSLSLAAASAALFSSAAHATQVQVDTPLGSFTIQMYDDTAPGTVTNFLNYVADGDFDDSFFHRMLPGFVVQGGGFTYTDAGVNAVPTDPAIVNEFGASNTRGTLAMAKLPGDPDSATSGWFINLADNGVNGSLPDHLDQQNGGFTVFAEVMGDGMDIVDLIAGLATVNAGGAFTNLPVLDSFVSPNITQDDVVKTTLRVVGDATGDAYVSIEDLDVLLANWGDTVTANDFSAGDFDGDGTVGQGDLDIVTAQWGEGLAPSIVPEPASALLVLGGIALVSRRRR